jgi:hypothetical protein
MHRLLGALAALFFCAAAAPASAQGLCDIAAAAGHPCAVGYGVSRPVFQSWGGALFQVRRASDNATRDIGVSGGIADVASLNSFCAGTTCTIVRIYDESGNGQDLIYANPAGDSHAIIPPSLLWRTLPGGTVIPYAGTGNLNSGTRAGLANNGPFSSMDGAVPATVVAVMDSSTHNSTCCYDFGIGEWAYKDYGQGTMWAIGTSYGMDIDRENGGEGAGGNWIADAAGIFAKTDGNNYTLAYGDVTGAGLTYYADNTALGFSMNFSWDFDINSYANGSAITLGMGGDSAGFGGGTTGGFFEGFVATSEQPDSTDAAMQANINAFYTSSSTPSPTASLSANPTTITSGGSSTLTWSSTNATSCTGTGFSTGNAISGTTPVSPAATTTYSVNCSGATAQATVTVQQPTTLTVGPSGEMYTLPSQAFAAAIDGDTIEIFPGTYTDDFSTIARNNLTIVGMGGSRNRPVIRQSSGCTTLQAANDKGLWVTDGGNITISGIAFENACSNDSAAAGIRVEGTPLTVTDCYFSGNMDGILTGQTNGTLTVEDSEFVGNGSASGPGHNIYAAGGTTTFTFIGNYSHRAVIGHDLKSRANVNYIEYNRLTDETGTGSFQADFPNGGEVYLIGNLIEKGPNTGNNSAAVDWGEEGATNPGSALYAINNTVVDDYSGSITYFNAAATPTNSLVENNIMVGPTGNPAVSGNLTASHNLIAASDPGFVNRAGYDYHLTAGSAAIDAGQAPGTSFDGLALAPASEFVYELGTATRTTAGAALDEGAFEYVPVAIQDPGFEAGSVLSPYWTAEGSPQTAQVDTAPADAHTGNNSGLLSDATHTGAFVDLAQTIPVEPDTSYTLTAWLKPVAALQPLLGVKTGAGKIIADAGAVDAAGYRQYAVTFDTCGNTALTVFAGYSTPGAASSLSMDDFTIGPAAGAPPTFRLAPGARTYCRIR